MKTQLVLGILAGAILGLLLRPLVWPSGGTHASGPGALAESQGDEEASGEPTLAGAAAPYPDVREELAEAQARIATLESQVESKPTAKPVKSRNPWASHKLPDTIWVVARRIGAPKDLVALAWALRCGAHEEPNQAEAALARLQGAGKEGLLAFAALSLGQGTGHTNIPGFIAKLEVPDADVILIDLIEDNEHPNGLVSALGRQDTQGSRDFLVAWLPKHVDDAGMYWTTATALGRLKEPRGAEYLDIEAITGPRWGGVRGHILWALGQMGGDEAAAKLAQYLKTPHADNLGAAASALAQIDKDAARTHAKRLLASDRATFIPWMDRSSLEKVAKDE